MTAPSHAPVLLDRVVALLAPALDHPGAVLVDCTLGLGGHSEAVLQRCPQAAVVGIDRYGESAPAHVLFEHFGFTPENVAATVRVALG